MQFESALLERASEPGHELAPEEPAQHPNRQEEPGAAGLPGASVGGQAARGDHAVHMGMVHEGLAPGVQDREEPEPCAEMLRVGGDLLERPGRSLEQEVVDDLGVLQRQRRQALRHRENHVRVGHRQHVSLARCEPGLLGAALALWAVAVAA